MSGLYIDPKIGSIIELQSDLKEPERDKLKYHISSSSKHKEVGNVFSLEFGF